MPEKFYTPECSTCRQEMWNIECWACGGEGVDGHDCDEDCCACAQPEDNVPCEFCDGKGGWYACPTHPEFRSRP